MPNETQAKLDPPKKGELWDSLDGTTWTCRVMADPIDGYVMARYKGASPRERLAQEIQAP